MEYYINPDTFGKFFTFPAEIADKHLKLASETQLKVILYIFRNMSCVPNIHDISAFLNISDGEAEDAVLYWCSTGILLAVGNTDTAQTVQPVKKPKTAKPAVKAMPTREDIGIAAARNDNFKRLINEAQIKLGRLLKINESATLLWLLEDQGMDVSVILMLMEYAISENRCNMGFIEKTAISWINDGVVTILDAENRIKSMYAQKTAWKAVERAFGFEDRQPSDKELEYARLWINEWEMPSELLKLAYDKCVDAKSKFVMGYTAKILEKWHNSGYKTVNDVNTGEKKSVKAKTPKNDFSTYDIDLVEKIISKGYGEN